MSYKLQILVPQYKEDESTVCHLFDSIATQRSIDFSSIGVIVCNDGSDMFLSDSFIRSYPFHIDYYKEPHRGVSGTRNKCLMHAESDYVMFCDADDVFFSSLGLYNIFTEMENEFDSLISAFCAEIKDKKTGTIFYDLYENDGIFVHGKVFRRDFLLSNNILFNEKLTINEDSYFVALCQSMSSVLRYIKEPFYLWVWRDESISHNDEKYKFIAYKHMFVSNGALLKEFIKRGLVESARLYAGQMIIDAFFTLNDSEWFKQENYEYLQEVRKYMNAWLRQNLCLWDELSFDIKIKMLVQLAGMNDAEAEKTIVRIDRWIMRFV